MPDTAVQQPAQAAPPEAMMDVFSPDGAKGKVPVSQWADAQQSGYKAAVRVTDPNGKGGWVPNDQAHEAITNHGYKLGPPEQQPDPTTGTPYEGYNRIGKGAIDALKGFAQLPGQVYHAFADEPTQAEGGPNAYPMNGRVTLGVKRLVADPMSAELAKSANDFQQGHTSEAIAHSVAGALPLVGPFAAHSGEAIGQDPLRGGTELAINMAVPEVAKQSIGLIKPIAKTVKAPLFNAVDKGTDFLADTLTDPRKMVTETIPRAAGRAVKRMVGQPPTAAAPEVIPPARQLGAAPTITPAPPDTSGSVPYTPPPVAATTRAERLGLMLPAAPPEAIPMPAVPVAPEPEGLFPAASTVVYDPVTGQSRTQFLTSIAEPGQAFSPQDSQLLNDPRGAFAKYAQGQDLGGLADPLTANNPSPITNPIKPQSTLPAWANELMGWEQNDPQHLFNQMDEHDFLNHQRQEEIQQWIAQHNKAPEPFAGKGLKTSEPKTAQRTLGQPPSQETAPQPQVEVATEENMQRKLQESLDQQAAKKATRAIGQPPASSKIGGAKILAGDIPLKGPVSPVEADISRLNAELKAATDPTEIADIKQALEHAQARMQGRPYTPPEQAEAENLPLSQPRTYQPPPYTRGQAPEGQAGAGLTPENPVPASSIQPGGSGTVKTSELNLDPKRFQYKTNTDQSGTTNQFKDTDTFNRNLAGVISTWTDPADGKTYVVNGHHRVELAQRTGEPTMLTRHLEASSPESARAQGALINIAEGRGTAVDAAKFFRDSTISPADLAKEGVSLSEAKVKDGIALSRLDPSIFDKVATGQMTEQRGIAIGNATSDPVQQHGIIELIEKQEAKGRKVTNDTVAELSRFVANSGNKTIEQGGLFGANQEIQSLALDKAELSSYVKQQLSKEKRIFGAVADQGKAQILSRVKDQSIQPAENAQISQQAAQAMEAYEKLSVTKGPIDDILESVAKDRADGKLKPEEARSRAYEGIRTELQKTIGSGEDGSGAGSKTRPGFPAPPKR